MTDLELFERIIQVWRRRRDPTEALTLNQIASLSMGLGNPRNSATVGRVLNVFRDYFKSPGPYGRKWQVRWAEVQRAHPHLFSPPLHATPPTAAGGTPPASPGDPIDGMTAALHDEVLAVRRQMEEQPVMVLGAAYAGTAGEGSFLYESVIELRGDSELPIPEGVGILLRWRGGVEPSHVDATLLSYDPPHQRIIFEVEKPLSSLHVQRDFQLLPRVDALIKAVEDKLAVLKSDPDALSWRLLRGSLTPRQTPSAQTGGCPGLDDSQLAALRRCVGTDITFVWGPPGTGKTHTLAKIVTELALAGGKVIVTAIANVAVDQVASRVVRALDARGAPGLDLLDSGRVIRFGHPRLPEVTSEPRLYPHQEEIQRLRRALHRALEEHRLIPTTDQMARAVKQAEIKELRKKLREVTKTYLDRSRIVFTTAVQVCLEFAFAEATFGTMVVDEASMMPIPQLACMGIVGRERLVVAGDPRQLGPIALSRSEAAYQWLHRDGFELVRVSTTPGHPCSVFLRRQRRMHAAICDLINQPFYDGKLVSAAPAAKLHAAGLPPLPGVPAVLVRYLPDDGSEVELTDGGSRMNKGSADVVIRVIRKLLRAHETAQIGVIAPYRCSGVPHTTKRHGQPRPQECPRQAPPYRHRSCVPRLRG